MTEKGAHAFRTISEASEAVGVAGHVLRFWETRFSFIRPMKRAGGRRFYRPQDLALLKGVRVLLHEEGHSIKGVQKLHREHGVDPVITAANRGGAVRASREATPFMEPEQEPPAELAQDRKRYVLEAAARERLLSVLHDLEGVKARIDALTP